MTTEKLILKKILFGASECLVPSFNNNGAITSHAVHVPTWHHGGQPTLIWRKEGATLASASPRTVTVARRGH